MGERRSTPRDFERSLSLASPTLDGAEAPQPSLWLIRDASGLVDQPFYAALDDEQRLCWTDDPAHAAHFDSKQSADRFALDRIASDTRVVPVAALH